MKLIAMEEHFTIPQEPGAPAPKGLPPLEEGTMLGAPWLTNHAASADEDTRIAVMDQTGVTTQILSTPFAQGFPADVAVDRARALNDYVGGMVERHPGRIAGFASLPTAVPKACAAEYERTVKELGFVGALIANRVGGTKFLDAPEYDDLLSAIEESGLPLYLHPGEPPRAITDLCYTDERFSDEMVSAFMRYGYGWHVDVGIHFLHMVMTGTLDKHPNLQIILGHWGELLPFYIDRFDTAMPAAFAGLEHEPSYYLRNNMYVTSSGVQTLECMTFCKKVLGADRLLFSADYPFANFDGTDSLLSNPDFTPEEIELFAHGNAERLLKL